MAKTRRSGVHAAVVLGALALAGCASNAGDERAKQVEDPYLYTGGGGSQFQALDCLSPATPKYTLVAKPHTPGNGTGYWSPFPVAGVSDPTIASYEQSVWNIPRANGYVYMVWVVGDPPGNSIGGHRYFFAAGIRDRAASPPYLMQPPGPADIRYPVPVPGDIFAATDYDFNQENTLRLKNLGYPVYSHDPQIMCAVVIAEDTGAALDYFPLADLHDPNSHPW